MKMEWNKKYQPERIDVLVGQERVKEIIKPMLKTRTLDNLLLHGPPGTGKSTLVRIINNSFDKMLFLKIDGGLEYSVEIIRHRLVAFLSCSLVGEWEGGGRRKAVIFNEADGLSTNAFKALKITMDTYQEYGYFIFITNDSNFGAEDLDDPRTAIRSRCTVLEFKQLSPEEIHKGLNRILDKEGLNYDYETMMTIAHEAKGDMRAAVKKLELFYLDGDG